MTASPVMHVTQLWRYPVKSLQGEELSQAIVDNDGIRGDRAWGVRDSVTGRILTGRREPRLLLASAHLGRDEPDVHLPTGDTCRGLGADTDSALSRWLGAPVVLDAAAGAPPAAAEFFADATDDASEAMEWTMPPGRFIDAMPLLIVTTASLAAGRALHPDGDWNPRRFRANVLIEADGEGWPEDTWCGHTVRIGEVELDARQPCVRCTMVTRPQPGLRRDPDTYRTLARQHGGNFGVLASVRTPGTIRTGDAVEIVPRRAQAR